MICEVKNNYGEGTTTFPAATVAGRFINPADTLINLPAALNFRIESVCLPAKVFK